MSEDSTDVYEARDAGSLATVPLLQLCPQLGRGLGAGDLQRVGRALTLPAIVAAAGHLDLDAHSDERIHGQPIGWVIATGLLMREESLGQRTSAQLLGPSDVLGVGGTERPSSLPKSSALLGLTSSTLAPLDDRVLGVIRAWPRLASHLMHLALEQAKSASVMQAIAQLPRAEDRLLAVLWHLADRWGDRHAEGMQVALSLSHEALGRLIGARRPTVSLALRELREAGAVATLGRGAWLLSPCSLDRLQTTPNAVVNP